MNAPRKVVHNRGWITGIYVDGELVYDITEVPTARGLDALGGWIFNALSEHPMSAPILVRWIRIQNPRLLPEAIERAIQKMINRGMLEVDARARLRVKGFLPIGFSLREERADDESTRTAGGLA